MDNPILIIPAIAVTFFMQNGRTRSILAKLNTMSFDKHELMGFVYDIGQMHQSLNFAVGYLHHLAHMTCTFAQYYGLVSSVYLNVLLTNMTTISACAFILLVTCCWVRCNCAKTREPFFVYTVQHLRRLVFLANIIKVILYLFSKLMDFLIE